MRTKYLSSIFAASSPFRWFEATPATSYDPNGLIHQHPVAKDNSPQRVGDTSMAQGMLDPEP